MADPKGGEWPAGFEVHGSGGGENKRYAKGWGGGGQDRNQSAKIVRIRSQNFKEVQKACADKGALWEDPDFPANDKSVYYSYNPSQSFEWKRPRDLADSPRMFVEGASRFDIVQGDLGNCWFLAALASMCASKKRLIAKVIPQDNVFTTTYVGAFHFRIWQYGKWVDVCIDDRLPTLNGRLVFVHSANNNEFWSALLEKAYAKVNGSYEAMIGGCAAEAMEDFTGGLCETYKLEKAPANLFQVMVKAYQRDSLQGCTIDAEPSQIENVLSNGLVIGHAYSITAVKQVELTEGKVNVRGRKENLLRIRNPWGNQYEWKGAWGDSSQEWKMLSAAERDSMGLNNEDDGEFWMTHNDFLANFHNLEICHLDPSTLTDESLSGERKWERTLHQGSWKARVNAGGCRNFLDTFWTNPQYRFEVTDPDEGDDDNTGTAIIALMQKETRKKKMTTGQDLVTMGYMIYKTPDNTPTPLDMNFFKFNGSASKSAFTNMREVVARHKLAPGYYVILPCTFQPNEEADFMIRVFTEKDAKSCEVDEDTGYIPEDSSEKVKQDVPVRFQGDNVQASRTGVAQSAPDARRQRVRAVTQSDVDQEKNIREIFKRTSGADMEVDAEELKGILNSHFKQEFTFDGFSKETCRSMVAMKDMDHSGKLGYEEFKKLWNDLRKWKKIFKEFDQDGNGTFNSYELREALNSAGFRVSNQTFSCLVMRYSDKTGKIFFDDFIMCAVKMKCMCEVFNDIGMGDRTANFVLDEFIQTTMYA